MNLLEAFNGKAIPRTRPIFWQWLGMKSEPDYWPRLAVRDGDWKLVMTDDAQRVELHHLIHDRAEANDVSKDHPEIVTRLTQLALGWKATLPTAPNPECFSKQAIPAKPRLAFSGAAGSNVPPEIRARAFTRWDTNKDDILSLEEFQTALKGQADLEARFKNFDKDGDSRMTRGEFIGNSAK